LPGLIEKLHQINATIMAERDAERNAPSIVRTIAHKIASDIRWDVAGLIGITVTLMLVIMIIAAQGDRIPEEVFVGWSVILGFYFGRTTAKTPKPSTEIIPQVTQSSNGTQGLLPQTPVQNTNQGSTT
jgi:Mn2+/Fe2+ NRAMP family transporter